LIIVFFIFIVSFIALLGFYLFVFSRLSFYDSKDSTPLQRTKPAHPPSPTQEGSHARGTLEPSQQHITHTPNHRITELPNHAPVSVIICAKNELENLKKFLPAILEQDYPEFEVLIVNDGSTDDTQQWLEDFSKQDARLRVIENHSSEKNLLGKRSALKKGIEAARYELVLLTDADCKPASNQWIKLMASLTPAPPPKEREVQSSLPSSDTSKNEIEIVLGFSPLFPENKHTYDAVGTPSPLERGGVRQFSNGFLNRFIRYENFLTALYYLSFTLLKMPYMGVGRNLLYRTSVTRTIGALEHHSGLISGDDDLTVNRIATGRNTTLMIHPNAHVLTVSPESLRAFIHQKRRHYSTGFHYQSQHQLVLGTLYGSQILFNVTAIALLMNGFMLLPTLSIFIIKNILQTLLYGKAMRKLNVHNLWIFTPVFDLCMSAFFLTLGGLSLFKTKTWK